MGDRAEARARRGSTFVPRACGPLPRRVVPLDVFVQPEAGEAPFLDVIARARRSIRVMVFQIGPGRVLDALARKAAEGVKVRLILDDSPLSRNHDRVPLLRDAGIAVRPGNPFFAFTHAKIIVIDDAAAVISTGNYVGEQAQRARDYAAIDRDPEDIAALVDLFDADWDLRPIDQTCARILISPDNARDRILGLIQSARRTLDVESMQLADDDVRRAIAARRMAGVRVRVVLADPYWVFANEDAAWYLAAHGMRARYLPSPAVHAKAIVVDGATAFMGSINLSYTSLDRNREVGVIVDDPRGVTTIARTITRDWHAAIPFVHSERLYP